MVEEKQVSVQDAARRIGVHQNTILYNIENGKIRAKKVLGRWRIPESEVERILKGEISMDSE